MDIYYLVEASIKNNLHQHVFPFFFCKENQSTPRGFLGFHKTFWEIKFESMGILLSNQQKVYFEHY